MGNRLALLSLHGIFCARIDGDVLASCFANDTGQGSPFCRLPCDRGNAEQFTIRVRKEIGQRDGIVHIRANVGVEKNFCHIVSIQSLGITENRILGIRYQIFEPGGQSLCVKNIP